MKDKVQRRTGPPNVWKMEWLDEHMQCNMSVPPSLVPRTCYLRPKQERLKMKVGGTLARTQIAEKLVVGTFRQHVVSLEARSFMHEEDTANAGGKSMM